MPTRSAREKELTIHAQVEEEIFYPAVRKKIKNDDLFNEAEVGQGAKDPTAQIEAGDPTDLMFDAKVTVLGKYKHPAPLRAAGFFRSRFKSGAASVWHARPAPPPPRRP